MKKNKKTLRQRLLAYLEKLRDRSEPFYLNSKKK